MVAIVGLVNKFFDTHIGLYDTEVPTDTVIVAAFFIIGVLCLLPVLIGQLRNRSAVK